VIGDIRKSAPAEVLFSLYPRLVAEKPMSSSRLFGAVVILSSVSATSVMAQAVISEPGYCAQFYPNANCQNKGPGNPYTDPSFHRNQGAQGWSSGETVSTAPRRPWAYRSGSSAARIQ
jgi:hypothetical protein